MNEAKLNEMSIEKLRECLEEQMNYSYELRLKTDKLQNNWNELKEWLEERTKQNKNFIIYKLFILGVLDKMECIEKGVEQEQVELTFEKVEE